MRMPAFVRLNALKNISAGAFSFSSHSFVVANQKVAKKVQG